MARGSLYGNPPDKASLSQSSLPRRATRTMSAIKTADNVFMEDNLDEKPIKPTRTAHPSKVPICATRRTSLEDAFLLMEDDIDAKSVNIPHPTFVPRTRSSRIPTNGTRRTPRQLSPTKIFLFLSVICTTVFLVLKLSFLQEIIDLFSHLIGIFQQQGITNVLQNIASIVTIITAILLPISAFLWKRLKKRRIS